MLAPILLAYQLQVRDGNLPIQIVPASQAMFERGVNILESKTGETAGIYLLNDPAVSDKAYEAIVQNPKAVQIVQLIRRSADGKITSWYPDGKPADTTPLNLPTFTKQQLPDDTVAAVIDARLQMQFPSGPADAPNVAAQLGTSKGSATIAGRVLRFVQVIGTPTYKFANIRMNFRVNQFVGNFSKEPNTTKQVEDVTYKVVGPMTDQGDKREHLEVIQSELPNVGSLALSPVIDWTALEADRGPIRNRNAQGRSQTINNADGSRPEKDIHLNVSSTIPIKYWSGINVYRVSNVQGFVTHIAVQPNG